MFETEIANYIISIVKRHSGERVPLSSLLTDAELPDGFKKFVEAEVDEMIDEEEFFKKRTARFNWEDPQVHALLKEIRHALKNSFSFTKEEFAALTEKAVKFIFNYIIRPHWTVEKFIFKSETAIDRSSIENAARFFSDYPYYLRGIMEYLEFHSTSRVVDKKNEMETAMWNKLHAKIDEQLLSMLPAGLENLTAPLFKLFQFVSSGDGVPVDALILFFHDKSAAEIVERIEFAKAANNIQTLDLPSLKMVLQAATKDLRSRREEIQKVDVLPISNKPTKEEDRKEEVEKGGWREEEKTKRPGSPIHSQRDKHGGGI